jgi:peptide/nickel transport system substrate-binding protein
VAAGALALTACGGSSGGGGGTTGGNNQSSSGFGDCDSNPNTCNSGTTTGTGTFSYAIEKNINDWSLNTADGNTFETAEVLDGVLPSVFVPYPDLTGHLNKDLMVSAEQTKTDPQTIVYKIQPNAKWNDGTPIDAKDFEYNWKTQDPAQCPKCTPATTSGYDDIQSLTPSDNGKTVTVVFKKPYTDWQALFGPLYPAHIAAQHGDINTPDGIASTFNDWFAKNVPTYSGGPYTIQKFENNVAVTLVPNDKYFGKKAQLSTLIFRIITDATQEPTALQNNEIQGMYPQPEVDLVSQVKQIPGVISNIGHGLVWEHFDLNLKNPALQDVTLRQAMFTAVNRDDIIKKTVGQFDPTAKPLNSHMFVPGQPGYQGNLPKGQGSGDVTAAKKMLTDAGYTGVGTALKDKSGKAVGPFRIRYTVGNQVRQNECELFAASMKQLGITVNVQPTDDLGGTLSKGDFDVIVFAWVDTPYPFSGAEQLWETDAGGNYGHYSNPQVDQLLKEAASSTDVSKSRDNLNKADELMSKDAYVLPLYQKPTYLVVQKKYVNIRNNNTNVGPPYNAGEWGLAKAS